MIPLLTGYLGCAVVLLVGALACWATLILGTRVVARSPESFVRWGWAVLALSVVLPLVLFGGQVNPWRRPALEIWSGPALPAARSAVGEVSVGLRASIRVARPQTLSLAPGALEVGLAALATGVLLAGLRLVRAERRLRRLCVGLPVVKRVGQVVLAAGPDDSGPFAARVGGRAYVVIPTSLFASADLSRLRMVLAHEAHHLRRGHVRAAQVQAVLRALFFWNPALALWQRFSSEVEDLSCDRHVLARWPGLARDYGRCLLWAAARGPLAAGCAPTHARTMARQARGPLARRLRVLAADAGVLASRTGVLGTLLSASSAAVVLAAGLLLHACVGTPRTTADEVEKIGQRIRERSGFPIISDGRIAEALNRRLNDPAWRDGVKAALERAPKYLPIIEAQLRRAGVPVELRAMVLTESRFDAQAHTSRPVERRAVGLWQLMPSTGRRLGLTVTPEEDQRLDPALASDAAARLLAENFRHYGDWPLAIAAYNGGRGAIDRLRDGASVAQTQDRLLASDAEFGRYLASVMISMLVMEDPELLD